MEWAKGTATDSVREKATDSGCHPTATAATSRAGLETLRTGLETWEGPATRGPGPASWLCPEPRHLCCRCPGSWPRPGRWRPWPGPRIQGEPAPRQSRSCGTAPCPEGLRKGTSRSRDHRRGGPGRLRRSPAGGRAPPAPAVPGAPAPPAAGQPPLRRGTVDASTARQQEKRREEKRAAHRPGSRNTVHLPRHVRNKPLGHSSSSPRKGVLAGGPFKVREATLWRVHRPRGGVAFAQAVARSRGAGSADEAARLEIL